MRVHFAAVRVFFLALTTALVLFVPGCATTERHDSLDISKEELLSLFNVEEQFKGQTALPAQLIDVLIIAFIAQDAIPECTQIDSVHAALASSTDKIANEQWTISGCAEDRQIDVDIFFQDSKFSKAYAMGMECRALQNDTYECFFP